MGQKAAINLQMFFATKKASANPAAAKKVKAVVEPTHHEPLMEELEDFGDEDMGSLEGIEATEGQQEEGWEEAEEKEDNAFEKLEDDDDEASEDDEMDEEDEGYF